MFFLLFPWYCFFKSSVSHTFLFLTFSSTSLPCQISLWLPPVWPVCSVSLWFNLLPVLSAWSPPASGYHLFASYWFKLLVLWTCTFAVHLGPHRPALSLLLLPLGFLAPNISLQEDLEFRAFIRWQCNCWKCRRPSRSLQQHTTHTRVQAHLHTCMDTHNGVLL